MAFFTKLTLFSTSQPVAVNLELVRHFHTHNQATLIQFDGGDTVLVKETLAQVHERLRSEQSDF
nr:hypothetical protein [uncultured Bradyrhizobium sp.]